MSRCFPFPPPGYEKKTKTENADFLTKEKNKEKKHKKEKGYKEKRENKDKRDKDKCKDKNKEENDQKEKHKDRKKDRNKGRTSEDKIVEGQTEGHNELHIRESWHKDEQRKDRTEDDRTSSSIDGSFSNSFQRKNGRIATSIASQEKERVADIKEFPVQISSTQRRNDRSGLSVEDFASSIRRTVSTSPATALENERSKMHEMVTFVTGLEQNRNHGEPVESISGLFTGKTEGSTAGMEMKNSCEKVLIVATRFESGKPGAKIMDSSSLTASQRRKDMANLSIRRIDGMGSVSAIEKQRTRGSELFPNPVTLEQRRNSEFCKSVEKDKVLKKDKTVDKKVEDRNRHKDSDHIDKWSKAKVKYNKEKKMEEKIEEKAEEVEQIELRNFGKKDQVNTLNSKPLAPHKDNTPCIIGIDEMLKKRKDLKNNGYLHEEDARPYKIPRMASSFQEINGSATEFPLSAPTSLSLKIGAMNTLKPDGILENKENKINGTTTSYCLPVEVKPRASGGLIENGEVSLELPHPDYKFVSQIYTVPVMEWSKIDDQDWLFNCCDSQGRIRTETEAQEAIHVWDEGLQIDSADVFAFPYVVPF